ncbi:MAG TPA: EAL domain-containing protein [Anaerolineales bacterium]|nr:EAL domain-containing protein [Anaerolineales bacterium]
MQKMRAARRPIGHFNTAGDMGFEFSFAFQPIVNAHSHGIISYEALVRGPHGEPAASVFAQVSKSNWSRFDEVCRSKAIYLASRLKIPNRLNLNMVPQSIYEVDLTITATFRASVQSGIPVENIVFELLESQSLTDQRNLLKYLQVLQGFGFKTAIDDFGAGYSGLELLVKYQPNYIKLDRNIISGIHEDGVKQSVFSGIHQICRRLCIEIIAEGVETADEYHWLQEAGIHIFQGYYFARPAFEALPDVADNVFSN